MMWLVFGFAFSFGPSVGVERVVYRMLRTCAAPPHLRRNVFVGRRPDRGTGTYNVAGSALRHLWATREQHPRY